jgi:hypothetical protein
MRRPSVFIDPDELLRVEAITHDIIVALVEFFQSPKYPECRTVVHVIFEPQGTANLKICLEYQIHNDDPKPPKRGRIDLISFHMAIIEEMKFDSFVLLIAKKIGSLMVIGGFCRPYSCGIDRRSRPLARHFSLLKETR